MVWLLEVWLPPAITLGTMSELLPQSWIPVIGCLDKRVRLVHCVAPERELKPGPEVMVCGSGPGGNLLDQLFPQDQLYQHVLVAEDWSPTGFGI